MRRPSSLSPSIFFPLPLPANLVVRILSDPLSFSSSQTIPVPSQPQAQLETLKRDVEQKLRLQSSLQQSFEMSIDERFASLKEEIKKELATDMKVSSILCFVLQMKITRD